MSKNDSLFDILKSIDKCETTAFEKHSDQYNPYITMKWLASCKDPKRIDRVNKLLNVVTFALHDHKHLLYLLSCALAEGDTKRYQWIPRLKRSTKKLEVVCAYFGTTENETRGSLHLYDADAVLEMATELGYTDKELKALKKSLNDS